MPATTKRLNVGVHLPEIEREVRRATPESIAMLEPTLAALGEAG